MTPRTTILESSERIKQLRAWLQKVEQRQGNSQSISQSNSQNNHQNNDQADSQNNEQDNKLQTSTQQSVRPHTSKQDIESDNERSSDVSSGLGSGLGSGRGDQRLVSLGCMALDRLLPSGGLVPGTVVEWLEADGGGGAGSLAIAAARQACHGGGLLVVLDRARRFYPPLLAAWGFSLERVVVVRPERAEDEIWAADQALRCPAVAAVWGALDWIGAVDFRRLKLAAEEGGTLGLLRRPARLLGQPTWADAQWWVRPRVPPCRRADNAFPGILSIPCGSAPGNVSAGPSANGNRAAVAERHLQATLVRCRGGVTGRTVALAWNERTGQLRATGETAEVENIPAVRKPRTSTYLRSVI